MPKPERISDKIIAVTGLDAKENKVPIGEIVLLFSESQETKSLFNFFLQYLLFFEKDSSSADNSFVDVERIETIAQAILFKLKTKEEKEQLVDKIPSELRYIFEGVLDNILHNSDSIKSTSLS